MMAFNNVPVNGWPQIKKLEELDALAKKVDNMPVFSSTDRDWLDEWESKLPELPADPETDGVKVLTATTESGETTKSWEEPESSTWDYSTSEVDTGQKWTDGSNIYCKVISFGALPNTTTKTVASGLTNVKILEIRGIAFASIVTIPLPHSNEATLYFANGDVCVATSADFTNYTESYVVLKYIKTEEQQTRKRGK